MSFRDLDVKNEYRSLIDNIAGDFYIPVLKEAVFYKRCAGFFSSTSLAYVTRGICEFIKNNGHIQIVACPILNEDDIEAIKLGYENRHKIVWNSLMRELHPCINDFEQERLNLLANLIANGFLDIKIAVTTNQNALGIYHEKMGILHDAYGNTIAFSGSANATGSALSLNYEAIDVYCDWDSETEAAHVKYKLKAFDSIWNNVEKNIEVIEFPDLKQEIIDRFKRSDINYQIDKQEFLYIEDSCDYQEIKTQPSIPDNVKLHDYQIEAIAKWQQNNFCGIFDMATSTGKTYTALGAIAELYRVNKNLAVIIVCPFQHLVDQWKDDARLFGLNPIVCHSASQNRNWKFELEISIDSFKLGVVDYFCCIVTNATFASEYFQQQIKRIRKNGLIVVDEAHNIGATSLKEKLPSYFKYRLALSATLERFRDEEGTIALYNYFGEKCIEYSLEDAIKAGKLTPYYYYPIIVSLTETEMQDYVVITNKINKAVKFCTEEDALTDKKLQMLYIKRARLLAGATNKLSKLKEAILPFVNDNHLLVYCGATSLNVEYTDDEEKRQIDAIIAMLGNDLKMRVGRFTSQESARERNVLKKTFDKGDVLQCLVAIKCLDEGVNIPSIDKAFILASSTNPKEYIQRRGRVLRLYPGKKFSQIYDFITLPVTMEKTKTMSGDLIDLSKSMVKKEIDRIQEFAKIAINKSTSDFLIADLKRMYKM